MVGVEGQIWSGHRDGKIRCIEASIGQVLHTIELQRRASVNCMAEAGGLLCVGTAGGKIRVLEASTGQVLHTIDCGGDTEERDAEERGGGHLWIATTAVSPCVPVGGCDNGHAVNGRWQGGDTPSSQWPTLERAPWVGAQLQLLLRGCIRLLPQQRVVVEQKAVRARHAGLRRERAVVSP